MAIRTINLSTLDGSIGFRLSGATSGDLTGISVSSAGDVNGDGLDDLIIGASSAEFRGNSPGAAYVVFGRAGGLGSDIDLARLNGSNGFRLRGAARYDQAGYSVSAAGDINGDGFAPDQDLGWLHGAPSP